MHVIPQPGGVIPLLRGINEIIEGDLMPEWPPWWRYELVLSPHVIDRMAERGFSEIDLRAMLEDAAGYRPAVVPSRFIISASHAGRPWEIVVEPDDAEEKLIIVTAYGLE